MWIRLSQHISIEHGAGRLFRDAAHQSSSRTKAQMTEQQITEAEALLDSSPFYKEIKERLDALFREFDPPASQHASEKSPPDEP
jgi:hypothetical protein